MEAILKKELGTSTLRATGGAGGGCISEGQSYDTDTGRVFVKVNRKSQAKLMFEGEKAGLEAILQTSTVRVPRPLKVIELSSGGAVFVMEHLDMRSLNRFSAQLGEQMADLHLHNQGLREKMIKEEQTIGKGPGHSEVQYVEKFGFHTVTCCGYIPQRKIPQLFSEVEVIPALLHGDLWGGNVAESGEGPLVFDPASFYGHSEFELAIAGMFGGFSSSFYTAYHNKIPKAAGFDKRLKLYQLFHYLNHWNHFGTGYRGSSLRVMKDLLK
nr:PREDICTED: ketosamine-3-kinase-like isoform X3 [Lepisosteus oculatus]